MLYINDSKIGLNISRIGLGTARMGSRYDEALSFDMLDSFFSSGGNFIDTARNYYEWLPEGRGKSEKLIGKWMQRNSNRDKICLLTKGGTHGEGSREIDLSESSLIQDVNESLDALKTDKIDIFALHRDDEEKDIAEIMYTMQKIIEIAKVKRICADCWSTKRLKEANAYAIMHGLTPFTVVETWWSLAEYTKEMWNDPHTTNMSDEMMNYVVDNEMIVVGSTSQCRGFFQKAAEFGIEHVSSELLKRIATKRNIMKLNFIKDYCEKNNISVTMFVNSYIYSSPCKGIGLVSCSSVQQLNDVLANTDYVLPADIRKKVDLI